MKVKVVAFIEGSFCTQCGVCVSECPKNAIAFDGDTCTVGPVDAGACVFPDCGGLCRTACPMGAIDFLPAG